MEDNPDLKVVPERISCSACQQEVPLSEAVVPEAADYVVHFCSLDCYASWRTRASVAYPSTR